MVSKLCRIITDSSATLIARKDICCKGNIIMTRPLKNSCSHAVMTVWIMIMRERPTTCVTLPTVMIWKRTSSGANTITWRPCLWLRRTTTVLSHTESLSSCLHYIMASDNSTKPMKRWNHAWKARDSTGASQPPGGWASTSIWQGANTARPAAAAMPSSTTRTSTSKGRQQRHCPFCTWRRASVTVL